MTITVYWAPHAKVKHQIEEINLLFSEPVSFNKYIRTVRSSSDYLRCYAFIDTVKNCFIVQAPLDIIIKFDKGNDFLSVDGVDQNFYDVFFLNRSNQSGETDPKIISCAPKYVFYADKPVQMSILPLPLIGEPENTRVVIGGFDISKWVRPVDWTFEIVDHTKEICVKRGDPLFMVMFAAEDGESVVLERVLQSEDLAKSIDACTQLKRRIPNTPLKKCYEMAENFISAWRKYRSK